MCGEWKSQGYLALDKIFDTANSFKMIEENYLYALFTGVFLVYHLFQKIIKTGLINESFEIITVLSFATEIY